MLSIEVAAIGITALFMSPSDLNTADNTAENTKTIRNPNTILPYLYA